VIDGLKVVATPAPVRHAEEVWPRPGGNGYFLLSHRCSASRSLILAFSICMSQPRTVYYTDPRKTGLATPVRAIPARAASAAGGVELWRVNALRTTLEEGGGNR